jgi:exonuclease III
MREEKEDFIAVQETHTEKNLRRKGTMPGYVFIEIIHSSFHGIAIYDNYSFSNCCVLYQDHSYDVHTLTVEVDEIVII